MQYRVIKCACKRLLLFHVPAPYIGDMRMSHKARNYPFPWSCCSAAVVVAYSYMLMIYSSSNSQSKDAAKHAADLKSRKQLCNSRLDRLHKVGLIGWQGDSWPRVERAVAAGNHLRRVGAHWHANDHRPCWRAKGRLVGQERLWEGAVQDGAACWGRRGRAAGEQGAVGRHNCGEARIDGQHHIPCWHLHISWRASLLSRRAASLHGVHHA